MSRSVSSSGRISPLCDPVWEDGRNRGRTQRNVQRKTPAAAPGCDVDYVAVRQTIRVVADPSETFLFVHGNTIRSAGTITVSENRCQGRDAVHGSPGMNVMCIEGAFFPRVWLSCPSGIDRDRR